MSVRSKSHGRALPKRVCLSLLACLGVGMWAACATSPPDVAAPPPSASRGMHTNREWQVLPAAASTDVDRLRLARAAEELGDWTIHLAGEPIDGPRLARLAKTPVGEPLVRAVREDLRRAVDLEGFLLWLDDVLVAGADGLRGETVWVSPGRGRKTGLLVHPDAIFGERPRRYGEAGKWLDLSPPKPQEAHAAALDGEPLGPRWTMRFRNPDRETAMLDALRSARTDSDFAARLEHLLAQLRRAGADVQVNSTVRHRERGYLMWGAFVLAHVDADADVAPLIERLDARNETWSLDVPILWRHPQGPAATRAAAREMAETYDVVYATEAGARSSSHYGGRSIDFTATGLPRRFELVSPDGERRGFDLSNPVETRDLSLTPVLIDWVETAFGLEKLRADYPHWNDAGDRRPDPATR